MGSKKELFRNVVILAVLVVVVYPKASMIGLLVAVLIASEIGNQLSTQTARLCGRGATYDSGAIGSIQRVPSTLQRGSGVSSQVVEHR